MGHCRRRYGYGGGDVRRRGGSHGADAHRTALVFSAVEREAIQEALELLRTRGYGIVSYELESERTASGIIYRANLLLQARKSRKGDAFVELLQQDPRILVERIA